MAERNISERSRFPKHFSVTDWREIFDLYPNQCIAIKVDEITPGVGITKGTIIARGSKRAEQRVLQKLLKYQSSHPKEEIGFFNLGRVSSREWLKVELSKPLLIDISSL